MHTFAIELAVIELGQTIAWRWWIRVRGVQWRCEGPTVDFSRLTHSWCTKVARLTGAKMPYRRWRPLTTYWGDKEPYTTSQRQFQWRQAAEERGFADCIAKQVARFSEVRWHEVLNYLQMATSSDYDSAQEQKYSTENNKNILSIQDEATASRNADQTHHNLVLFGFLTVGNHFWLT